MVSSPITSIRYSIHFPGDGVDQLMEVFIVWEIRQNWNLRMVCSVLQKLSAHIAYDYLLENLENPRNLISRVTTIGNWLTFL